MNATYAPYGAPPHPDIYYETKYASPSPTPSPRRSSYYYEPSPHAARQHVRHASYGAYYPEYASSPMRNAASSPRFDRDGHYATANVSSSSRLRKDAAYWDDSHLPRRRERSSSYTRMPRYRPPHSIGDSDEDEFIRDYSRPIVVDATYGSFTPKRSSHRRNSSSHRTSDRPTRAGTGTNERYYAQQAYAAYAAEREYYDSRRYYDEERRFSPPRAQPRRRASVSNQPRPSVNTSTRPSSARRPSTSSGRRTEQAVDDEDLDPPTMPPRPQATQADADKHRIPPGYQLKNWDPTEEPILLVGSVFDATSLGRWIYDWTSYVHGPTTPICDVAGELWLLIIQLSGRVRLMKETMPEIRLEENRHDVEGFIGSGERLMDTLRRLLRRCEAAMLNTGKRGKASLDRSAGCEFVKTMFGRDRALPKTEDFMQKVRLWNMRYDANVDDVIQHPEQ